MDSNLDSVSVVFQCVGLHGVVRDVERSLSQRLTELGVTRTYQYRRLMIAGSCWSDLRPVLRTYEHASYAALDDSKLSAVRIFSLAV